MITLTLSLFFTLLVLVLTILCYFLCLRTKRHDERQDGGGGGNRRRKMVILFIDAPDPDNPAAAVAVLRHVFTPKSKDTHLHMVLTGRPLNLRTAKVPNKDVLLLESITRQDWESDNPEHAQKVLEDAAARLNNYLVHCNINVSNVTIYNGGVAPCAPLSDRIHDWDFLFDRKDLITGQETDQGSILSPEEYQVLMDRYNSLTEEEREDQFLSILRSHSLAPLSVLRERIQAESCTEVVVFLGGPATGLVEVFSGDMGTDLCCKVTKLFAMFGSLDPGKSNLLRNQFNVACDVEAAYSVFGDMFAHSEKHLIATETAKNKVFSISSQELQSEGVNPYVVALQRLWESTHNGCCQPLFDVLPVMAYSEKLRGCFKWSKKKAVLVELRKNSKTHQIFRFADSDGPAPILVSEAEVVQPQMTREKFVEFLQEMWTL